MLGQIEEYFLETLAPNDTFLFGGEILALHGIVEDEALVSRAHAEAPKIPSYDGGKFPLSTHLAKRVREMAGESETMARTAGARRRMARLAGASLGAAARRTVCSSRPFRAALTSISSPIHSKGGSRIRRSACC